MRFSRTVHFSFSSRCRVYRALLKTYYLIEFARILNTNGFSPKPILTSNHRSNPYSNHNPSHKAVYRNVYPYWSTQLNDMKLD